MHFIQKYILDKLIYAQYLRNRDMRPPHIESNLYQYHLKRLIDSGYVKKAQQGYELSTKGLQYADKHSSDLKTQRPQPKLVTILIIENEKGEVLLVKRDKQPFIGLYNLPSGKIHEGESLIEAGMRELLEKTGITDEINLVPSGTVHLTVADGSDVISESYGFVLYAKLVDTDCSKGVYFDRKRTGGMYNLMPGVTEIISKASIGHKEVLTNTTL